MKKGKKHFQFFFQNKLLITIFFIGLLSNLTAWVIFWLGLDFDKTALILHYNSFFGIDRIAVNSEHRKFLEIFFVPVSGLLIMLVNFILGGFLIFSGKKNSIINNFEKNNLNKINISILGGYFIFFTGLILQIVIFVYAIAIVLVNR